MYLWLLVGYEYAAIQYRGSSKVSAFQYGIGLCGELGRRRLKVSNLLQWSGPDSSNELGAPVPAAEPVFIYRKKWQQKEMCWEPWKPSSGCFICRWESFLVLSSLVSLPLTFQLTWKWDKLFESFSSSAEVPGANPFWRASLCTWTSFEVTPLSSA